MNQLAMKSTRKMALLSIATSIVTLALKFGAYFLTDSVSLLSDALEAIVNVAAGLVAFGALTIADQPADDRHNYGHDKAEYFSSGVEGVLILVAAVSIIVAASGRFLHPVMLENLGQGLIIGLLAAAMNFATARVMLKAAREHDSITIEADGKYLMTDVWTSGGVLAGLFIIMFVPEWHILDPLIAVAVGIHIILTGMQLLRRTVSYGYSIVPGRNQPGRASNSGTATRGASFHDLRTRKAGARRFIEFHLLAPGETSVNQSHALCDGIEYSIKSHLSNASVTIHVEPVETETPVPE
jgi:cation diffusion facilitator family transporter